MAQEAGPRETAGRGKESPQLRPGDRIGPYRVEETLGSGGMGEVVLAYDERLDRRVAIKRIRHDREAERADRVRLRREARAAAALSHPSIVQIFDILSDGDEDSIVMEYVPGSSVAERLKEGPLPLSVVLDLGRDVAAGLAEAHRSGLVHRDLKAENVMMAPRGPAKILDFGLAKHRSPADVDESLTADGALLGTVRAMAPEQARGGEADSRSDLYSLGVLLFEALAARSPFRGANAFETLQRVLTEPPPSLRRLRPDLPMAVVALVENLLEKDPDKRPQDAQEVLEILDSFAFGGELGGASRRSSAAAPPDGSESLSDAPTGSLEGTTGPAVPTAQRLGGTPPVEDSAQSQQSRRSFWKLVALLGVVSLFLIAGGLWRWSTRFSSPLRVVVLPPELVGTDATSDLDFVASGLVLAALRTLSDLEGVTPVAPHRIGETSDSFRDIARAVAADEVLRLSMTSREASAWVTLQRIRGADGEILWAEKFDAPIRPSASRLLAEALAAHLRRGFPSRSLRQGALQLEISDSDYAAFVEVSQRIHAGGASRREELEILETIAGRSPRFPEAGLRAAKLALTLYSDTRDGEYLEMAETLLGRIRRLIPNQPAPIQEQLRLALARGDPAAAKEALAELDRVAPHSVAVLLGHSQLAKYEGDLGAAEDFLRQAVERWPIWQNLYELADLERRRGNVDGARRTLGRLIQRAPANPWGLGKLAQLELQYGDLQSAEGLLLRAIEVRPHRSYYTNLGLTYFLLGRFELAKDSYLRALTLDPGHRTVRLNLADVELALGHDEAALEIYRGIARDLGEDPPLAADRMTLAQCLAHLGDGQRAVASALETLQAQPEDSEVAYQAALVYALVGETTSALVNAEKALERGVQIRWFNIPGFESLRSEEGFQALLEAH